MGDGVEHQNGVVEEKHRIIQSDIIQTGIRDLLNPSHGVVREISHRASRKARQTLQRNPTVLVKQFAEMGDRVPVPDIAGIGTPVVCLRPGAGRREFEEGIHAEEAVPCEFFRAFDTLQQERVPVLRADFHVRGYRCFGVREYSAVHREHCAGIHQSLRFLKTRRNF
ncbi:MAG: hypothetical protein BWY06_01999 [Candidatus Latescibacteria bacterium ADurb.Bin168]|nr:MAG: hypothetical protein BWY06_01999 [Candidatus Latescibacteria bacterium ADurb.Bin168]